MRPTVTISYAASLLAGASPAELRIRHSPRANNSLTTDLTVAPGDVMATGSFVFGEVLLVGRAPTNDNSCQWGGSGTLDNIYGTRNVSLRLHRADGSIETFVTVYGSAAEDFSFSITDPRQDDRIEMIYV